MSDWEGGEIPNDRSSSREFFLNVLCPFLYVAFCEFLSLNCVCIKADSRPPNSTPFEATPWAWRYILKTVYAFNRA